MNLTANFERLSGLINQSSTNERKARLIAHYKKVKEAKREEQASADWRRATPLLSSGSTFYKDLFDLRNKTKGKQDQQDLFDTTL